MRPEVCLESGRLRGRKEPRTQGGTSRTVALVARWTQGSWAAPRGEAPGRVPDRQGVSPSAGACPPPPGRVPLRWGVCPSARVGPPRPSHVPLRRGGRPAGCAAAPLSPVRGRLRAGRLMEGPEARATSSRMPGCTPKRQPVVALAPPPSPAQPVPAAALQSDGSALCFSPCPRLGGLRLRLLRGHGGQATGGRPAPREAPGTRDRARAVPLPAMSSAPSGFCEKMKWLLMTLVGVAQDAPRPPGLHSAALSGKPRSILLTSL